MANADVEPILMMLAGVLEPLPEAKRAEILGWVEEEIAEHAILQLCQTMDSATGQAGYVYELGQDDPTVPLTNAKGDPIAPRTVFAILQWELLRTVVVLSFSNVEIDEQPAVQFFRSVIYDPKFTSGPINHHALYKEIRFLLDKDEAEGPQRAAAQ